MEANEIISARVHFIAGKGGVGKSLLSSSLAHFFANEGRKTLLVNLSEDESSEGMCIPTFERLSANLFYVKIFPDQAAYQYLRLKIPQKKLLDALLRKRLFRVLCSAMPGLSDLTRLGKIWFHASTSMYEGQEIFDKIVVDLPSSGFVKRFLSVADVVSKAVKIGPLAKEAELIHRFFIDAKNARLHIVAVPEELIVSETKELVQSMQEADEVKLGWLFINRAPAFSSHELLMLEEKLKQKSAPHDYVEFLGERTRRQERLIDHLRGLGMPVIAIDEIAGQVEALQVQSMLNAALGDDE